MVALYIAGGVLAYIGVIWFIGKFLSAGSDTTLHMRTTTHYDCNVLEIVNVVGVFKVVLLPEHSETREDGATNVECDLVEVYLPVQDSEELIAALSAAEALRTPVDVEIRLGRRSDGLVVRRAAVLRAGRQDIATEHAVMSFHK